MSELDDLKKGAAKIRDEIFSNQNSATRVGEWMTDVLGFIGKLLPRSELVGTTGDDTGTTIHQKGITHAIHTISNLSSPFMRQGIQMHRPNSEMKDYWVDLSLMIKSVNLSITSNFRKKNDEVRKIKLRSIQYITDTSELVAAFDIEDENGVYINAGVKRTKGSIISYSLDWGTMSIEFDTQRVSTVEPNIPASFEQGGINEKLVENAVLSYEFSKNITLNLEWLRAIMSVFKDVKLTLSNKYVDSSGSFHEIASFRTSQFIEVAEGDQVKYFGNTEPGGASISVFGYDSYFKPVKLILKSGNYVNGTMIEIPSGVSFIVAVSHQNYTLRVVLLKFTVDFRKKVNRNLRNVGMSIWLSDGAVLIDNTKGIGYQTILKEQFKFISQTTYAYSGHSLGGLTKDDTSSIMNKSTSWIGTLGDIWTLDSITNDFKRNIPIGTITEYNNNTGISTFYGALRAFRDKVIALSGDMTIVVCSNALRRNNADYTSISTNAAGHKLVDYEKAIMEVAALNKWYFVDQFRMSGITDESLSMTTFDGLHLNNFGYRLAVLPWISIFDIVYNKLLQ